MPSTYSTNLAIELIATGEQAGTWGITTDTNLGTLIEQAISGYVTQAITDGVDTVITIPNGATGVARNMYIEMTGALTATRNLIVPANRKLYFIYNNTSGGFAVTVKVSGQTGVSVPNGAKILLVVNGTDVVLATNYLNATSSTIPANGIYLPSANTLGFATNSAQAGTVSAAGNLTMVGSVNGSTFNGTTNNLTGFGDLAGNNGVTVRGSAAGAPNIIDFYTNGVNSARLDASGNLGLGVTPSAWGSSNKGFDLGSMGGVGFRAANFGTVVSNNAYLTAGDVWTYKTTAAAATYQQTGGAHYWGYAASGTAGTTISGLTTGMTLDASGKLFCGGSTSMQIYTSTAIQGYGGSFACGGSFGTDSNSAYALSVFNTLTSGNNNFVTFNTEAGGGTQRGSITFNRVGVLTAYNTTSDYRAKEIIGPVTNSGVTIDALKVYTGKMHGATLERPMMIAHEAQQVVPYAVTGEKDAVDEDGKPILQQMDHQIFVPLLIAEIQSLRARLAVLEAK